MRQACSTSSGVAINTIRYGSIFRRTELARQTWFVPVERGLGAMNPQAQPPIAHDKLPGERVARSRCVGDWAEGLGRGLLLGAMGRGNHPHVARNQTFYPSPCSSYPRRRSEGASNDADYGSFSFLGKGAPPAPRHPRRRRGPGWSRWRWSLHPVGIAWR